jgi:arabinose-5-phosphate isomerase
MATGSSSDQIRGAAHGDQARARLNNLKVALDWIGTQLQSSPEYQASFDALVDLLTQRRQTMKGRPGPLAHSQIHMTAIGKSGDVARLLVAMLTSVGIRATFLHPTEALHGDLGAVGPDDAVVMISYRGESSELLELAPLLKHRARTTVAITAFADAPLARLAQRVLLLPAVAEMSAHDHAPITSTVVTLALGQLLVAATMDGNQLDLESYAWNHPGGAIGRRIFTRVDDLMTTAELLPLVTPSATFEQVVSTMTDRALGLTFVVDGGRLAGIITEKDLRDAMQRFHAKIFDTLAQAYMNPSPITIAPGTLAVEAFRMMQSRPRPLNFLPVVTAEGQPMGLVRMHDLMKAGIRL